MRRLWARAVRDTSLAGEPAIVGSDFVSARRRSVLLLRPHSDHDTLLGAAPRRALPLVRTQFQARLKRQQSRWRGREHQWPASLCGPIRFSRSGSASALRSQDRQSGLTSEVEAADEIPRRMHNIVSMVEPLRFFGGRIERQRSWPLPASFALFAGRGVARTGGAI